VAAAQVLGFDDQQAGAGDQPGAEAGAGDSASDDDNVICLHRRRAERLRQHGQDRHGDDERLGKLLDWLDDQAEAERPAQREAPQEYVKHLSIPFRDRILIVSTSRLVSIEIVEGITRVYLIDEASEPGKPRLKQHLINYTLDQLDARLDPEAFMRVHRSAIVQMEHIKEMIPWFSGRFKLVLSGGHEVIASRERSKLLKDRLMI
jgi:two-component system LytT family response regulator